jgi:hypothetical protein
MSSGDTFLVTSRNLVAIYHALCLSAYITQYEILLKNGFYYLETVQKFSRTIEMQDLVPTFFAVVGGEFLDLLFDRLILRK